MNNYTDNDIHVLLKRVSYLEQNGIPGVRDFFATSALSILSNLPVNMQGNYNYPHPETVAKFCYEMADAMLLERDKKKNE